MIMDQHKNGNDSANGWQQPTSKGHRARDSMKIADIVDEHGIDYDSEEEEEMQQQRLERQSNDEKDEETKERPVKTRTSRESRQLDDNEVNSFIIDDETKEEEEEPKRVKKNRKSRESRQIDDNEWDEPDPDVNSIQNNEPKRIVKPKKSRESRQINDSDLGHEYDDLNMDEDEYEIVEPKPSKKARGSVQMEAPILSMGALETHNEHHLEDVAAEYNGPKDAVSHKRSDTVTA